MPCQVSAQSVVANSWPLVQGSGVLRLRLSVDSGVGRGIDRGLEAGNLGLRGIGFGIGRGGIGLSLPRGGSGPLVGDSSRRLGVLELIDLGLLRLDRLLLRRDLFFQPLDGLAGFARGLLFGFCSVMLLAFLGATSASDAAAVARHMPDSAITARIF